ncbi:MAG: D-tyrosyl-tRNA(Tyr) deacylase [Chloroflexi bacterium 44-23]|nr:MAG: D-tyrosyl-tRNA(Tyr) deacylase [Chloroflexi bacterium 44-23]
MRAVIQRVAKASVSVKGQIVAGEIQQGLLILLGIGNEDNELKCNYLAKKIANLRIFSDAEEKMNLSILDVAGKAIVVSQFTLYADTNKGNRPSFIKARVPEEAKELVEYFVDQLKSYGIDTQQGVFGADMQVALVNDGPVTIWMDI